jgi:hypothetical protein
MRRRCVAQKKVIKKYSKIKNILELLQRFSFPENFLLRNGVAEKRCGGDALRSCRKKTFLEIWSYIFLSTHTHFIF